MQWNVERVAQMDASEYPGMDAHYAACIADAAPGTSEWSSACRERREFRAAVAAHAIASSGRVAGEGAFANVEAPGGIGEAVEAVEHRGSRSTIGTPPLAVRRLVRDARVEGRERRKRRAVMAQARAIERERRASIVSVEPETLSPLEDIRAEIERGRFSLTARPVVERLYIRDDSGKVRQTQTVEAPAYMLAVERLTMAYVSASRHVEATMRIEPHGEGRGTVERAASSVNGTETRVASRWQSTPRVALMTCVAERNGVRCVAPIDWTCYRLHADGTREPLVSTATGMRRKQSAKLSAAAAERRERDAAARARLVERLDAIGASAAVEASRSSS